MMRIIENNDLFKEHVDSFIDGVYELLDYQDVVTIQLYDKDMFLEYELGMLSCVKEYFDDEYFHTLLIESSNSYTLKIWI